MKISLEKIEEGNGTEFYLEQERKKQQRFICCFFGYTVMKTVDYTVMPVFQILVIGNSD